MVKIDYSIKLLQNKRELPNNMKENFGIIKVKVPLVPMNKNRIHLIFSIDRSGSMGNREWDGHTALDHLKHVLLNMLNYFTTLDSKIYITINMFDHEINQICKKLEVTKDSIKPVITNLQQIHARGTTNIQKALQSAGDLIIENIQNVHIFMTDGLPTDGASKCESLAIYLPEIKNDFIGFGLNHDEKLLRTLADKGSGDYHFINNDYIKFGEIEINLNFDSLEQIYSSTNNNCN